jgi:hypothetical protein
VGEAPGRLSEWTHHVEVPDGEGPRGGDCLQRLRHEMSLSSAELAPFIAPHDVLRVGDRRGPLETLSEGFFRQVFSDRRGDHRCRHVFLATAHGLDP